MTDSFAWGTEETKFFFELTPDRILSTLEDHGLETTGRCLQLNSMENRVYELEIDLDAPDLSPRDPKRFRIVKFYRPGRWTKAQILEEHNFLEQLLEYEIPVVAPCKLPDGSTLGRMKEIDIFFALFPKAGGRIPDELDDEQLSQVGRLLARLHNVGATEKAKERLTLSPETYGRQNLAYLLDSETLPEVIEPSYIQLVESLCDISEPWFEEAGQQRIHGDCHRGNILWSADGPFLVDFDDMVNAACVQDLWLLLPGRDQHAKQKLDIFLEAYESMRSFPYETLRLIEPLRALRMVHFSAWIAKRWDDPAFQRTFPDFGSDRYWQEQLQDLHEQLELLHSGQGGLF